MKINKEYTNALKWYKWILKYSWILQRNDIELKAYDNISFEYFYIGKIEKSKDYHDRYIRRILEPK